MIQSPIENDEEDVPRSASRRRSFSGSGEHPESEASAGTGGRADASFEMGNCGESKRGSLSKASSTKGSRQLSM
jgi:hypothetical protein